VIDDRRSAMLACVVASMALAAMDTESDFQHGLRESASQASCEVCEREVPLSEAVAREASDYMAHFCGLQCYERWRQQAALSLVAPSR